MVAGVVFAKNKPDLPCRAPIGPIGLGRRGWARRWEGGSLDLWMDRCMAGWAAKSL